MIHVKYQKVRSSRRRKSTYELLSFKSNSFARILRIYSAKDNRNHEGKQKKKKNLSQLKFISKINK